MFTELIVGVFLLVVGFQGYFLSLTVNFIVAFIGILLFLNGLGKSDELDRENKFKPPMGPGGNVPPVSNPPHNKEIHPNILCGSGEDDEESKEDEN